MRVYRDRQRPLAELHAHLAAWSDELLAWETQRRVPITGWEIKAPEGAWRAIEVGGGWDDRFGIHAFRSGLIEPIGGAATELRLDFSGEALVRLVGTDGQKIEAFGSNPRHPRFQPVPATPFRIEAEVAARTLFGVPQRSPHLARADLVAFYPQVRALQRRVAVIFDASRTVKDQELARALCEAAEFAFSHLRLPTATDVVGPRAAATGWADGIWERSFEPTDTPAELPPEGLASVEDAIAALDEQLAILRKAYPKQGNVLVAGHAHIDYAWLWPQPETVRKIHRTFSNVNALLKHHDDFTFLQSSSLFYRHVEEDDPELLSDIQRWASIGRWEPIGGMLIECDTNMPSAEAFLRQFLLGQRDFERFFGKACQTAWLPDTFGFTAAMPQIMRHAGIDALVTIKVTWNETNPLPENIFMWRGNDGSEVLTHTYDAINSDGYNMWMTSGALAEVWAKHSGKDFSDTVIATYGWGDGGGGPDPDQIESMPIINLMPQIPSVRHGSVQTHLDKLREEVDQKTLPRWSGEMYLEYHRATLTSQGRVKQLNRRAELGLVAAEALAGIAALSGVEAVDTGLSEAWVLTLRNQFHDILPGSSIREVSVQTEAELGGVCAQAEGAARQNLLAIAAARRDGATLEGVAIANLNGTPKAQWQIQSDEPLPQVLQPQAIEGGFVATGDQSLPPLSVSFVDRATLAGVSVDERSLENAMVRVALDDHGRLASVFDKRAGRELLAGPGNRLMIYRNDLPRRFDAWDIEPGFEINEDEVLAVESIAVTARGPHLAEIAVRRRFGASSITQRLRLWANSPRLDIVTDLDWHDRRTYLRAAFDINVLANEAQFDQAIGVTGRATHDNTTWQKAQFEACGHRFVSLSETDWGAALLSSDKYGFSAKGNRLTISLVRGPMYPDMLADEGKHHFTYSLLPHDGRWWSEAVQAEADLVVDPLRFVAAEADERYCVQPVSWSGQQLRVHALKPAEDGGGHVLRVSESAGRRGGVSFSLPGQAVCVDGLEQTIAAAPDADVRPFELRSIRF